MNSKKVAVVLVFFILTSFSGFSQIFGFPIPAKTNLSSQAEQEISGSQFTVYQYSSSLSQSEILQFYQQNLSKKGWGKLDLPMLQAPGPLQGRVYNFIKGDQMLVLNFSPLKAEELIFYSISVGEFPKAQGLGAEQGQPLGLFEKPKSLDFMPLYPGSRQIDYRKTPSGLQAGYMASGGIEAVKGFYLQKMPQQGWSLSNQEAIGSEQYDLSKVEDCPTCPKIPQQAKAAMAGITMEGVSLEFKQGGKACLIHLTRMEGFEGPDLTSLGLGDIIITVVYHDAK
ncbi:MAG: hypothetical protein ABIE75_02160 [Candidatus Omnitrophota bacterium]